MSQGMNYYLCLQRKRIIIYLWSYIWKIGVVYLVLQFVMFFGLGQDHFDKIQKTEGGFKIGQWMYWIGIKNCNRRDEK